MTLGAGSNRDMPCELVTWDRFNSLARQLTQQIRASGIKVDMIVAIGPGSPVDAADTRFGNQSRYDCGGWTRRLYAGAYFVRFAGYHEPCQFQD